ncbi:3D (Asp-Asp-Asp) domain-containing protein [Oceanobacillus limi]|uniref:3D (Asp-Asp-Asp) domain-containing protein n=1 Tax=Oceanobacillus limi TaxID=930131 RepID=A0A1I0EBD9_9BACI|nr:3D (Asp-Asp-Asp) domain-containing protein [Oceanobacillus limi]
MIDDVQTVNSDIPTIESEVSTDDSGDNLSALSSEEQSETFEVEATSYTARCEGCSGITYTGYDVRNTVYTPEGYRIIAVDPSIIPLHSTVRITLGDGTTYEAKALDIGGSIVGKRIDFLVETREEALQFGRQTVSIEILNEVN